MIKKLTTLAVALSAILTLTACNENSPTTSVDNAQSTQNIIANNNGEVKFSTISFDYELPQAMKEICDFEKNQHEEYSPCTNIDIRLAKIEPIWIEWIVNKAITDDDSPKLTKFKQSIDEFVNDNLDFLKEMKVLAEEEDGEPHLVGYGWVVNPELLPAFNHLVQVVIHTDMYMGGAHGVQNSDYLIFDTKLQSQIELKDVIDGKKEDEFYQLCYESFKDYLAKELEITTETDIKEYEEMWQFGISENFYFDEKGLSLVYQPYEMGAYAQGFITLTVPYDKLMQILKEPYLPKA